MKKLTVFILTFCLIFFVSSCKEELNLEMYLSQLRTTAYHCFNENYSLTVYAEEREDPFISDGYVGTTKKIITVKLDDYKKSLDNASVTLSYGGEVYTGKFDYSPLSGKFSTEIEVKELPTENVISIEVKNQGEQTSLSLERFLPENIIDYKSALSSVSKKASDIIDKMLEGGSGIEVRLRLIAEGERGYYYVSITDKNSKTIAYLVDGASGEILASKTL